MRDLLAGMTRLTRPGRCPSFSVARGWQQPPLADLPRHVVVLARVAERSRHAAAAGVEIDDRA